MLVQKNVESMIMNIVSIVQKRAGHVRKLAVNLLKILLAVLNRAAISFE